MGWAFLADLTLLLHLAFIAFVIGGGLLVVRLSKLAPVHLGCASWGAYVELSGRICPLTPLENHFSRLAGRSGYEGGFIEQYLVRVIYPDGLTLGMQQALGVVVILVNLVVYARLWRRRWPRRGQGSGSGGRGGRHGHAAS